jgi:hypothetical protein
LAELDAPRRANAHNGSSRPRLARLAPLPEERIRIMIKLKPIDVAESETAIAKSVDIEPDKTDNTPGLPDQQNENVAEQLDEEEAEFRSIRRDLPGAKGVSAAGIVTISVGKTPTKNEFFRTHPEFRPIVPIVDLEVGMEKQFFAVTGEMVEALNGIGITVTDHVLYLTITSRGAIRIVPVRQAGGDGEQNEYNRTKEIGLVQGIDEWVRLFTDQENHSYKVFPAPAGRFGEPQWPELKHAKIFRLAFRDRGRLVDSTEHPLFKKWAARDSD